MPKKEKRFLYNTSEDERAILIATAEIYAGIPDAIKHEYENAQSVLICDSVSIAEDIYREIKRRSHGENE